MVGRLANEMVVDWLLLADSGFPCCGAIIIPLSGPKARSGQNLYDAGNQDPETEISR